MVTARICSCLLYVLSLARGHLKWLIFFYFHLGLMLAYVGFFVQGPFDLNSCTQQFRSIRPKPKSLPNANLLPSYLPCRCRGYDQQLQDPGQRSPATPTLNHPAPVATLFLRQALVTDVDRICNVSLIVQWCRWRECRGPVSVNGNSSSQELRLTGGLHKHIVDSMYCVAVAQAMKRRL